MGDISKVLFGGGVMALVSIFFATEFIEAIFSAFCAGALFVGGFARMERPD